MGLEPIIPLVQLAKELYFFNPPEDNMTDRPEIKQLHKSDFQLWNVNYKKHILRLIYDHLQK